MAVMRKSKIAHAHIIVSLRSDPGLTLLMPVTMIDSGDEYGTQAGLCAGRWAAVRAGYCWLRCAERLSICTSRRAISRHNMGAVPAA
jgi:hypothetical protein